MKKSKKKFVLAGLVLLAITMVLLPLSGCKNDTVPPEVEKQEQTGGTGGDGNQQPGGEGTVSETSKFTVTFHTSQTAGGYSIGWGKGDGKVLKNHYPKGLRR